MIRLAGILLFAAGSLAFGAGCERRAEPAPEATGGDPPGAPIVIVARVVDAPRPPPCGASIFQVPVRYQVLSVEQGALAETDILVRHDCPERPRPAGDAGPIEEGQVHRLTLAATPHVTARRVQWLPLRTDTAGEVP